MEVSNNMYEVSLFPLSRIALLCGEEFYRVVVPQSPGTVQ